MTNPTETHPRGVTTADLSDATAGGATPLIEVRGLTKTYGHVRALDSLDLTLEPGRIVGLLGQNGCGKTTLLKVLASVLADHEGHVRIDGLPLGPETKGMVSFLPDTSALPNGFSAAQCVRAFTRFFPDFDADKAGRMLAHFDLDPAMKLSHMSKGMREKAQVALTMSRRARVFLLDEPISGVDPAAREVILDGIVADLPENALVLISTHLIHDLEPVLDSAVMMRAGQVILTGDVDDLRAEHGKSLDAIFREVYR